jgi:hypothetical protein
MHLLVENKKLKMMRKRDNLKITIILILLLLLIKGIDSLPWWAFTIPVSMLGITCSLLKWKFPGFRIGFFSGLIVWSGASFYFITTGNSELVNKVSLLVSVNKFVIILASGLIGGLLCGLSLFSFSNLKSYKKIDQNTATDQENYSKK